MLRAVSCLSALALAAPSLAGQCRLIDVNASIETPFNGNPKAEAERPGGTNLVQGFVKCGAYWYFVATSALGEELWRTDATTAGTLMVKDIFPGPGSSQPKNLICCLPSSGPALLFFQADRGTEGVELWVSDGTEAGTTLVADIWPGVGSSSPQSFECLNGKVYFSAIDGDMAPSHGRELWCSDGTAAGTMLVLDIEPGPASGAPRYLKRNIAGTQVYFNAFQTATGREPWVTGGTAATTGLLQDIQPGAFNSDPMYFVNHNGTTLFNAFNVGVGRELWKTNGTAASTVLVSDLFPGPFPGDPRLEFSANAKCGNRLFFTAFHPTFGLELWHTDGTAAGTNFAGDIGGGGIASSPTNFALLGPSKILFTTTFLPQLFVFDCATDQLSAVDTSLLSPSEFVEIGGRAVFAGSGVLGRELYVTDGTSASFAVDINPVGSSSPTAITAIDASRVILAADDPTGPGRELWISDGTAAGTSLLKDIEPEFVTASGEVSELTCHFGQLVFAANDGTTGVEPFTLDAAGVPALIKDIVPGLGSSAPRGFTSCWVDGRVLTFFVASTPATGLEPWVSDGTAAGTILLGDLVAGAAASDPSQFTCCDDQVFFVAANELWVTDGRAFGTRVIELDPSSAARPDFLTPCKGKLYFSAFTSAAGRELMTSDGTESGTRVIRDIVAGSAGSAPAKIVCCGDRLYFVATEANGTELWTSNGTAAGTVMAANIAAGSASSSPTGLTCCQGRLFFQASGVQGAEPYVSDGTPAGTVLLKDVTPGLSGSFPEYFTCCLDGNGGHRVTFVAQNGTGERVLWRTDGTPAGTVVLENLGPVLGASEFFCCGTRLYFQVSDSVIGRELWVSDGTANGTTLFCDIEPEGSSDPTDLVCCGGKIYLAATTIGAGRELIVIDAPGATVEHVGTGCAPAFPTMTATPPILGGTVTFSGTCAPSGHVGVVVFDVKGPPYTLPFLFANGCSVMPNILLPTFVVLPGPVLGPNWTYPLRLPDLTSLQGACLTFQSWWINLGTVFPMATSNSVLLGLSQF